MRQLLWHAPWPRIALTAILALGAAVLAARFDILGRLHGLAHGEGVWLVEVVLAVVLVTGTLLPAVLWTWATSLARMGRPCAPPRPRCGGPRSGTP